MEVRAGDDNEYARYHVDDTNMADKTVWITRNEDTSVADGAPPPPSMADNSLSFSLSVAVRSIALLSGTWCLRRKAQHEAPAAEMVARGCIDDIVRDFYCSVQSPAFYAYCCFRWIGTNRATSDYRVALLRCLEVYLVVVLQSRSVFSFRIEADFIVLDERMEPAL